MRASAFRAQYASNDKVFSLASRENVCFSVSNSEIFRFVQEEISKLPKRALGSSYPFSHKACAPPRHSAFSRPPWHLTCSKTKTPTSSPSPTFTGMASLKTTSSDKATTSSRATLRTSPISLTSSALAPPSRRSTAMAFRPTLHTRNNSRVASGERKPGVPPRSPAVRQVKSTSIVRGLMDSASPAPSSSHSRVSADGHRLGCPLPLRRPLHRPRRSSPPSNPLPHLLALEARAGL